MDTPLGPHMKKLIAYRMASLLIPPDTADPFNTGWRALRHAHRVRAARDEATRWVAMAIAAVKAAPDNTFPDDEAIAGELLRRLTFASGTQGEP